MNGILFERPPAWGLAWELYRRIEDTDSLGDPIARYDMGHPDYTATADSTGAVAWQLKTAGSTLTQSGEEVTATAEGVIYDASLELAPFDWIRFGGEMWEITAVEPWHHYRKVTVERI